MDINEKDPAMELLEFFDVIRQAMEQTANKDGEMQFRAQCADLANNLWWFMEEMVKVGFSNAQAFVLLESIVIEGVKKNG